LDKGSARGWRTVKVFGGNREVFYSVPLDLGARADVGGMSVLVCVRGTNNAKDALEDVKIIPFHSTMVRESTVHKGFHDRMTDWMNAVDINSSGITWDGNQTATTFATNMIGDIETRLGISWGDVNYIVFSGHSLGAAISQMLAVAFDTIHPTMVYNLAYACPNVWTKGQKRITVGRYKRWANWVAVASATQTGFFGKMEVRRFIDPVPIANVTGFRIGKTLFITNWDIVRIVSKRRLLVTKVAQAVEKVAIGVLLHLMAGYNKHIHAGEKLYIY
jgi:hypothetical protein